MIENAKDHPVLKDLDLFQVTFAWMSLLPALRKYGTRVPFTSIRDPFLAQESWVKVRFLLKIVPTKQALQN